jgi:hypothetical protein
MQPLFGFTLASELINPDAVYCLGVMLKERHQLAIALLSRADSILAAPEGTGTDVRPAP